ncbi:MAG: hypothetical protein GY707_19040, partial [Desulfobacteraceae bacterium]|nr:hypothetical protein [Desulfobacteraceae bacterium]
PLSRLDIYKRSFFPIATKIWNNLSICICNSNSVDEFKNALCRNRKETNILYYYGQRWPAIHHSRLRLGCSKLKHDLCFNLKVIDEPSCSCGAEIENASHFFFECPLYTDIRNDLMNAVTLITIPNIDFLLFGNPQLDNQQNKELFNAVHLFITKSNRFK